MTARNRETGTVKTTETVFSIIEGLEELEEARLSALAEYVDFSVSTVHDHLTTLEELGYVVREDNTYRLGLRFLRLGNRATDIVHLRPVRERLEDIAEESGETAWFVVEEDGLAVHIDRELGEHGVRTANRVGRRSHLHIHAGGKAILAHLPEERVREIIDEAGLPASTKNTITAEDELFEELERVADQGYAMNDNEEIQGARSVAAPIVVDAVLGAVSIGGPANRIEGARFREELPELVTGMVNEIELELQYGRGD